MLTNHATLTLSVFALAITTSIASASVVPYTEFFAKDNANWGGGGDWTVFAPLAWTAPGLGNGPFPGAGYVSATVNFGSFDPGGFPAQTIFRGQDNYNSSGGAFVGNWNASNIVEFSFWVRHNAPADILYSVRFTPAGANAPSMNYEWTSDLVAANAWTKLTLAISPDTPGWVVGGGPNTYNTVFNNLGKIQIGIKPDPLAGIDQDITFDLSMVSIAVPAPGALALFALAGFARTRRRRH